MGICVLVWKLILISVDRPRPRGIIQIGNASSMDEITLTARVQCSHPQIEGYDIYSLGSVSSPVHKNKTIDRGFNLYSIAIR